MVASALAMLRWFTRAVPRGPVWAASAVVAVVLSLLVARTTARHARLDADEQRLRSAVATRLTTEALPFLARTVEVSSGTLDREGVLATAALYEPRFARLGFTTRRIDLASVGRGCHLVAERKGGRAATRLLLLGHLDTVFEKDSGFVGHRVARDGQRLEGPGVSDMKGGNLVIVEALEAVHAVGSLEGLDVIVVLTGDEEDPGADPDGGFATTRGPLVELASRADYALAFEPMNGAAPRPIAARRGYAWWSLEVTARSAHSSLSFTKSTGPGAIVPLSRVVDRFYRELRTTPLVSVNIANVAGGSTVEREKGREPDAARTVGKRNIVPATAHAYGDLRTPSAERLGEMRAAMRRIVDSEVEAFNAAYDAEARISATFTLTDEYPAMTPTEGSRALLAMFDEANRDLGGEHLEPADPMTQGAGDVSFVASTVKGALDGLGPVGFDYHTPREATDVASLRTAIERTALLLHRLATGRVPRRAP